MRILRLRPDLHIFVDFVVQIQTDRITFIILILENAVILIVSSGSQEVRPFATTSDTQLMVDHHTGASHMIHIAGRTHTGRIVNAIVTPTHHDRFHDRRVTCKSRTNHILLLWSHIRVVADRIIARIAIRLARIFGIFRTIPKIELVQNCLRPDISVIIDLSLAWFPLLGRNQDNTVRTTSTIDCCCRRILQHFHRLYIRRADFANTASNGNTINHIQRIIACRDRTFTTDHHVRSRAWRPVGVRNDNPRNTSLQGFRCRRGRNSWNLGSIDRSDSSSQISFLYRTITNHDNFIQTLCILFHQDVKRILVIDLYFHRQKTDIGYFQHLPRSSL